MPPRLDILRINHINHIVADYDEALSHYCDLFGGQFLMKIGANPFTDGCLIDVGGEIIEILAPKVLDKAEGKQLTKYGPHYQGIEFWVPSTADAREAVTARGIRLMINRDDDFFTMAADTQGVVLQIFDGNWHRDPPPENYSNAKRPASWWRDEHPIGIVGLAHMSFATRDLETARAFWLDLTGGRVTYRAPRPNATATSIGLDIGIPVELLAPTGDGTLSAYLDRYGPRIRATTFRVRDLDQTATYFKSRGIELIAGDVDGSLMIPPEENLMVVFQFMQ